MFKSYLIVVDGIKAIQLSAVYTGRLYLPGDIRENLFCQRLSPTQSHNTAGSFKSMTPSEFEPAAFQLAAQCLIQQRHRVLQWMKLHPLNILCVLQFIFAVVPQNFLYFKISWYLSLARIFIVEDTSSDINNSLNR